MGSLVRRSAVFVPAPCGTTIRATCRETVPDFFLGHRRLAIIDLADSAAQPMSNEDGAIWVVFNGEIYNHESLRHLLQACGHRFRTDHSDTEVLAHGYEQWGTELVNRLRGMFAFGILDLRKRELFLARDRFGEKPLYYRADRGGIAFASELKALRCLPGMAERVNRFALIDYLSHGFIPAPRTVFDGVCKMQAAHAMLVPLDQPDEATPQRYWSLRYEPESGQDDSQWQERFQEELQNAIRLRLMSDVPLGVFLSGGLDSTVVAAGVSRSVAGTVRSFSVGFSEPRFDELPWAQRAARKFRLQPHTQVLTAKDLLAEIDTITEMFDEPFADSSAVPTYLVAKMARQQVTVALSGDGGDELLAGYTRYRLMQQIGRFIDWIPPSLVRAVAGPWQAIWPERARGRALLDLIVPGAEARYRRMFSDTALCRQIRPEARAGWTSLLPSNWTDEGGEPVDRLCSMDRQLYIPEDLMVKSDRTSMQASLEVRAPLLDHKLFELVARMPLRTRLDKRGGKLPFRTALERELGREFVTRPKKGFSVPLGAWFRQELREPLRGALLRPKGIVDDLFPANAIREFVDGHQNGTRDQSTRLWRLYMLAAWHERVFKRLHEPSQGMAAA